MNRIVKKMNQGSRAVDGAGVQLIRVLGYRDTKEYDPFLMLDAFDSTRSEDYIKGFPWHPHRGIETITYLIEGEIEHSDSLGNHGTIQSGDCQWMSASSGIIHQEMPQASPRLFGIQLWLNLPAEDKMKEPKYKDIRKGDIPVVKEDGVTLHLIAGTYKDHVAAFQSEHVKATLFDVEMDSNSTFNYESIKEETMFLYIFEGEGMIDKKEVFEKSAVLLTNGDTLTISTKDVPIRFLLISALPLKEEIAWGGPIVMNTKEQLHRAFDELDEGTFIKHKIK